MLAEKNKQIGSTSLHLSTTKKVIKIRQPVILIPCLYFPLRNCVLCLLPVVQAVHPEVDKEAVGGHPQPLRQPLHPRPGLHVHQVLPATTGHMGLV